MTSVGTGTGVCLLGVELGGRSDVRAAGRQRPAGDARCGLLDGPVGCLFGAVVGPAPWGEVALVGGAAWPGDGVVQVGGGGGVLAAGGVAGRSAGADQVPQRAAGGVVVFGGRVVTVAPGDG